MEYVYAISDGKHIKIGVSKNPKRRVIQLNTGNANNLYLLGYFEGNKSLENYIHNRFDRIRFNGEWMYATDGLLEYLNSRLSDVYIIIIDNRLKALKKMSK